MKNFKLLTKARYCGYILLVAGLFSCRNLEQPKNSPNCNKWQLTLRHNWADYTTVICDSCQMLSDKEAIVWTDGRKTKIYAMQIRAHFLPCNVLPNVCREMAYFGCCLTCHSLMVVDRL